MFWQASEVSNHSFGKGLRFWISSSCHTLARGGVPAPRRTCSLHISLPDAHWTYSHAACLFLDAAGIELDERGMPKHVDERTMRIGDSAIFMAGDIDGTRPVLHEATAEGRIAGQNAARYPDVRAHVRHVPLGIMFTEPNVAIVGHVPTEGEGVAWAVGEVDFRDQGRARVINQAYGRTRIYARHDCGTIFAAELIGPGVEHMAHLLAWAIEQRVSAKRALELPIYHPVLEEGLRTALRDAQSRLEKARLQEAA
jgi:dihydrolipoamide dehydrogenase